MHYQTIMSQTHVLLTHMLTQIIYLDRTFRMKDNCSSDYSDEIPMVAHVPVIQESTSQHEEISSTVDSVNVSSSHESDVGDVSPKVRTVSVEMANDRNGRIWDNTHCCTFCAKMYPKLPCHLEIYSLNRS